MVIMQLPTKFFKTIYQYCEGRLELRAFCDGQPNKRIFCAADDHKAIEAFCTEHRNYNCFFGVGTRDNTGGGSKENVIEIPALWVDVDFKDTPINDVKTHLDHLPFQPSILVLTGHGVHFYWPLKEPAHPEEFSTVEDILRRICAAMGGDRAACEVARVLRIPNTINVKSTPVQVKIHRLENIRYDLGDFDILPEASATGHNGTGQPTNPPGWMIEAFRGVSEGGNNHFVGRDAAAVKVAGYFVNSLHNKDLFYLLQCLNVHNEPPLKDSDLKRILNSVRRYKGQKNVNGASKSEKKRAKISFS